MPFNHTAVKIKKSIKSVSISYVGRWHGNEKQIDLLYFIFHMLFTDVLGKLSTQTTFNFYINDLSLIIIKIP